jgi:hypothetical protein
MIELKHCFCCEYAEIIATIYKEKNVQGSQTNGELLYDISLKIRFQDNTELRFLLGPLEHFQKFIKEIKEIDNYNKTYISYYRNSMYVENNKFIISGCCPGIHHCISIDFPINVFKQIFLTIEKELPNIINIIKPQAIAPHVQFQDIDCSKLGIKMFKRVIG